MQAHGGHADSASHMHGCKVDADEIREIIGADSLGFLSEEHVFELADGCKLDFCAACFNGKYPIEIPADTNKTQFEKKISEKNEKENL